VVRTRWCPAGADRVISVRARNQVIPIDGRTSDDQVILILGKDLDVLAAEMTWRLMCGYDLEVLLTLTPSQPLRTLLSRYPQTFL